MTNLIRDALEEELVYLRQDPTASRLSRIEKLSEAVAALDKGQMMYCAFEFSYNGLCPDKDSAQDVLDAFGEKELSPIPVLVIPLEQEKSE